MNSYLTYWKINIDGIFQKYPYTTWKKHANSIALALVTKAASTELGRWQDNRTVSTSGAGGPPACPDLPAAPLRGLHEQ